MLQSTRALPRAVWPVLAKWAAGSRGLGSCPLFGAMRKAGAGFHLCLCRICRISGALTWTVEQDRTSPTAGGRRRCHGDAPGLHVAGGFARLAPPRNVALFQSKSGASFSSR